MVEFDFKGNLKKYCPVIFEFLNEEEVKWSSINKSHKERFNNFSQRFESEGAFRIKASIFDVIISAYEGKKGALYLLDFFKYTIKDLIELLDTDEKILVKGTLHSILVNRDEKYLNFLGELAVLVILKKNNFGKLIKTEASSSSHKPIDFLFNPENNDTSNLVEVQNIHIEEKSFDSLEEIKTFFSKKSKEKINEKFSNHKVPDGFVLVQVIWGENFDSFQNMLKILKAKKLSIPYTEEPLAFLPFGNNQGRYELKFNFMYKLLS